MHRKSMSVNLINGNKYFATEFPLEQPVTTTTASARTTCKISENRN